MNAKKFALLAFVTFIAILLAQVATDEQGKHSAAPKAEGNLYPGLLDQVATVREIKINNPQNSFTVQGEGEQWKLLEKAGYPAALDKVRQVIAGVAGLEIQEAKTRNPALFERLQVEDRSAKNAQSTQITLLDKDGKALADVLVGKSEGAKVDRTRNEIYVRKAGEQQSWQVIGYLPADLAQEMTEWLDKSLMNIDAQRLKEVSFVYADGEEVNLLKLQQGDKEWQLLDIPEGQQLKGGYMLNGIASIPSNLSLDDVLAAKDFDFGDKADTATYRTFDGLVLSVRFKKQDEKTYVAFSASVDELLKAKAAEQAKPKEGEEKPAAELPDVSAEAASLNQKLADWVYVLPAFKANNLGHRMSDLAEVPKAAAETAPSDALAQPITGEMSEMLRQQLQSLGK